MLVTSLFTPENLDLKMPTNHYIRIEHKLIWSGLLIGWALPSLFGALSFTALPILLHEKLFPTLNLRFDLMLYLVFYSMLSFHYLGSFLLLMVEPSSPNLRRRQRDKTHAFEFHFCLTQIILVILFITSIIGMYIVLTHQYATPLTGLKAQFILHSLLSPFYTLIWVSFDLFKLLEARRKVLKSTAVAFIPYALWFSALLGIQGVNSPDDLMTWMGPLFAVIILCVCLLYTCLFLFKYFNVYARPRPVSKLEPFDVS